MAGMRVLSFVAACVTCMHACMDVMNRPQWACNRCKRSTGDPLWVKHGGVRIYFILSVMQGLTRLQELRLRHVRGRTLQAGWLSGMQQLSLEAAQVHHV
jgi:hypothetical protein